MKNYISVKKWDVLFKARFGDYLDLNNLSESDMEELINLIHELSDEDIFELMPEERTEDCVTMSVSWADYEDD